MTSFIIVATDQKSRQKYINDFCETRQIDLFDRTTLTLETSVKQNTQSIGIEDIKHMQKKIFLKPIKGQLKAIIIEDANLLTPEAQNALLKTLEEPPAQTIILLSTPTKETLLPTILSRCFLVQLDEKEAILSEKERVDIENFLASLSEWGIGERLKKAESLAKDKEKLLIWLSKVILVSREKLLTEIEFSKRGSVEHVRKLQTLHTILKTTNVNPRMAIENTLLSIDS